jgi:hypothetical protein
MNNAILKEILLPVYRTVPLQCPVQLLSCTAVAAEVH